MAGLAKAVEEAGGTAAGREHAARLRDLLLADLQRGDRELHQKRSGYEEPVTAAFGTAPGGRLAAALPVPVAIRADAEAVPERAWLVVAAAVRALVEATGLTAPTKAADLRTRAGALDGRWLALTLDGQGDPELAALAFDEATERVDRLRARAVPLPPELLAPGDWRAPIGDGHPLRVAETAARLGANPADADEVAAQEEAILALIGGGQAATRPHDDPDPAKRVARRILQRLDGMGKWGGYHTEFAHLPRGFAGNDRALAERVGEALIDAELLAEKPSVGQRHVFLNPRRAGEIRRLIERGDVPPSLKLPRT